MNARSLLAACLTSVTLVAVAPGRALAQEATAAPAAAWVAPIYRTELVPPRIVDATSTALAEVRLPPTGSVTTELAVSHGAKIAIIVCAIVVGVIILVGVFAISGPHHP